MPHPPGTRRPSFDLIAAALWTVAALISVVCFVLPLAGAAVRIVIGAIRGGPLPDGTPGMAAGTLRLFLSSVGWAALIACIATIFACGAAWTMWRCGRLTRAAIAAPLLMPSALAFAGWGLLRAPDTWLGAALERAAQHGWHEAPVAAGRALAALGLSLWAFPVGAIVVWNGLRTIEPSVLEALRLDGGGRLVAAREMMRACRGDALRGGLLVGLLVLGSAVPLHLAQVETLAIQVWFALDNLGLGQQWRAWVAAWPLVTIAVAAGWWLGGRGTEFDPGETRLGAANPGARDLIPGMVPWVLAVGVPLALFTANLGQIGRLGRFWEVNGRAIATSIVTAACVAMGTMALSLAAGRALAEPGPTARLARLGTRLSVICALLPGVLIGSAMAGAVTALDWEWLDDSLVPVIAAHLARFGFIGALAGCWSANAARRFIGDQARLDGADRGIAWWRALLRPVLGVHLAAAAAAGVLSLHEIEATVQVMPPGDCLARVVLGDLHYSRIADMSAAGVWLLVLGLVPVGFASAWRALVWWKARRAG